MSMWNRTFETGTGGGNGALDEAQANSGLGEATEKPSQSSTAGQMNIGKLVCIRGELTGSEDLTLDGQFEGSIDLAEQVLTIGPNAKVEAEVYAREVIVQGRVLGNIKAADLVAIRDAGWVEGDVVAPRFAMAEGAHFNGRIVMQLEREATDASTPSNRPAPVTGGVSSPAAGVVNASRSGSIDATGAASGKAPGLPSTES